MNREPAGSRAWRAVGRTLSRRTALTMAVVLVITLGLAVGLRRLDFATGQDSYLDPSSQVAKDNARYQSLFGGESMVVLFTVPRHQTVADLVGPRNVEQFNALEQQLQQSAAVQSVVSPITLLTWTQDLTTKGVASEILARFIQREPDPTARAARQQDAPVTVQRLGTAGGQTFDNPAWVRFLVFGNDGFTIDLAGKLVTPPDSGLVVRKALRAFIPDNRHAIFAAILTGNAPLDELAKGSAAVKDALHGRTFDNATVTITGTPTFLTDINDYLQGGMLILGGIAVLVMIVILVVAFGVRWRLLPLLGMAVGVAWVFGAFGFTGTKLSLVTAEERARGLEHDRHRRGRRPRHRRHLHRRRRRRQGPTGCRHAAHRHLGRYAGHHPAHHHHAAKRCGVTQEQLDAAAAAAGG